MISRLTKIIDSFRSKKRVDESEVSTSVDDMKEGKRQTFEKERVDELLVKCGLLEKPESEPLDPVNELDKPKE